MGYHRLVKQDQPWRAAQFASRNQGSGYFQLGKAHGSALANSSPGARENRNFSGQTLQARLLSHRKSISEEKWSVHFVSWVIPHLLAGSDDPMLEQTLELSKRLLALPTV